LKYNYIELLVGLI